MRITLARLLEAYCRAAAEGRKALDFGLEWAALRGPDLDESQLHALVLAGIVEDAGGPAGGRGRHLALTSQGAVFAAASVGDGAALAGVSAAIIPPVVGRPSWDVAVRELRWHDHLVKRFRRPAPNQELVLTAFEEQAWMPRIDDPLPRQFGVDPKERVRETVKRLNNNLVSRWIRFESDGTGKGFRWQPLDGTGSPPHRH